MLGYNSALNSSFVYGLSLRRHLSSALKVGCHGPRMRTEIYCSANFTLNLRVDSEYVVA